MELALLKVTTELIDVPLVFDDDGNVKAGFKVVGADSDEYQTIEREYRLLNVKRTARRGRGIDAKSDPGAKEVLDVLAKREMALLNACIKETYGFTTKGQPAVLGEELLTEIFAARPTWKLKTLTVIESEELFIKASSAG